MNGMKEDPEQARKLPGWVRALAIVTGIISIVAAFIVLIYPAIGVAWLIVILAIGLLFNGIFRLAAGIPG